MRLLYVIDSLVPGGAETSLAALAPHYVASGIELHVGYYSDRPGLQQRLVDAGATLHHLGTAGGRPGRVRRTASLIRSLRPELVHTTLFEADVAGRPAAHLARVPVVTSLVSESYGAEHVGGGVGAAKLRLAQALDAATCRGTRRFHAITTSVARTMARRLRLRPGRIDVVYRGRDAAALGRRTAERRAATRAALGIGAGVPLVLGLGRLEHPKGFDVLLAAVPALVAEVPGVQVRIAGRDGASSPSLRATVAADRGLDAVGFLGHRDDAADLLCAADVLAFPSRREGLGGVVVEAMALECPVVASDLAPVREVLGGCGLLVPAEQPEALAQALVESLTDTGASAARAAAGRQRFLDHFTIERSAAGMLAFYERALATP